MANMPRLQGRAGGEESRGARTGVSWHFDVVETQGVIAIVREIALAAT